jgi:hypothetical protein
MRDEKHESVYPENAPYFKSLFSLLCLAGIFSISIDSVQASSDSKNSSTSIDSSCSQIEARQDRAKGAKQVCETSIKYVVKIRGTSDSLVGQSQGSGFIVKKVLDKSQPRQYKYYVLTNKHVLQDMQSTLSILTSDRDSHSVYIEESKNPIHSDQFDLSVFYFTSRKEYPVANIDEKFTASLEGKESSTDIFILGYPRCQESNCQYLKFTQGKYGLQNSLLGKNRLLQGYSLPYNNDTEEGMSGSPVLNKSGNVIGIHGRGKYGRKSSRSDIPDAYALENGQPLPSKSEEMMKYFSWGIPIDLALEITPSDPNNPPQSPKPSAPATLDPDNNFTNLQGNLITYIKLLCFCCLLLCIFGLVYKKNKKVESKSNNSELNSLSSDDRNIEIDDDTEICAILRALQEKDDTLQKENENLKQHIKILEENDEILMRRLNSLENKVNSRKV